MVNELVGRSGVGNWDGHCGEMGITRSSAVFAHGAGLNGPQVPFDLRRVLGKEGVLLDESKVVSTKRK